MTVVVTGGAGFIGSNLIARLLSEGATVVAADNFSRGRLENLSASLNHAKLTILDRDLADEAQCAAVFDAALDLGQIDEVWHLAANSDIAAGVADPTIDLRDTFLTTFEVLRQMRRARASRLFFASSSAIYGDLKDIELAEDTGPLFPISNYGAMKLASEAQASAAAESFLEQVVLFRFPNVVGVPATHGVILDFIGRLATAPHRLEVWGNGTQRKPYLHVGELVAALLVGRDRAKGGVTALNIGPEDIGVTVATIAEEVVARVSPGAAITFGAGDKGWVGDVSQFRYSISQMRDMGWRPALSSLEAIRRAIDEIASQEGF
jgi:UDP-glucose 4-epimerase